MEVEGGGVEAIGLSPPRDELGALHSGTALGLESVSRCRPDCLREEEDVCPPALRGCGVEAS